MAEPSDEALTAYVDAWDAADPSVGRRPERLRAALAAALAVAEKELRARVAYDIRAELVCCNVYERDNGTGRAGKRHAICFWGEAAARIAEDADPSVTAHPSPVGDLVPASTPDTRRTLP